MLGSLDPLDHSPETLARLKDVCERVYTLQAAGNAVPETLADERYRLISLTGNEFDTATRRLVPCPVWQILLGDDGSLDTTFDCYCLTCGHSWQERFTEQRSEDQAEDAELLDFLEDWIREQEYVGSGVCQCEEA